MRTGLTKRLRKAAAENRGIIIDRWEVVRVLAVFDAEWERLYGRNKSTVERVYETRIDCRPEPGGARRLAFVT